MLEPLPDAPAAMRSIWLALVVASASPAGSLVGWRYSEPGACGLIGGEPIISPTDAEIAEGQLDASSVTRAVNIFRA